jgi:hypothetical protein
VGTASNNDGRVVDPRARDDVLALLDANPFRRLTLDAPG